MTTRGNRWRVGALTLLLAAGAGCAPSGAGLEGQVTHDGQPLRRGTIIFRPVDGNQGFSSGADIEDGRYLVPVKKGVVPGIPYHVEISALRNSGKKVANMFDRNGTPLEESEQYLPAKYNTQSILKVTPEPGMNHLDFALEGSERPARGAR